MATYTGSAGKALSDYWSVSTVYAFASNAITLGAGVKTANVTLSCGTATNYIGYAKNTDQYNNTTITFYLSNSDMSHKVSIGTATISRNGMGVPNITKNSANLSSLAGEKLYVYCTMANGGNCRMYGKIKATITTVHTAVTAGNKILATDRSQTGTDTTAGAKMTDSHFDSGTKITASAFNSTVLGL